MNANTKPVHLVIGLQPDNMPTDMTAEEKKGLERYANFGDMGNAYAREHGTRPATIGLVLSSSPVAQLAWFVVAAMVFGFLSSRTV